MPGCPQLLGTGVSKLQRAEAVLQLMEPLERYSKCRGR